MKLLKKNIKWIILVIILMIIVSGVSAYATSTYLASQVTYKDGKSVADALNYLYEKINNEQGDEFANKQYIQTGLNIYNNRITITDGGYYTDSTGITYVNMTFKVNTTLYKNDIWVLLDGLPSVNGKFIVTDIDKQRAFYIGTANGKDNAINFFDKDGSDLTANSFITLKFKY